MLGLLLGCLLVTVAPVDTVVVCPAEFRPALQPWVEYRTAQGHSIAFVDPSGTAEAIAERVRQQAKTPGVRFVVLVGDAEPNPDAPVAARARCVPTHVAKAKVNVHWGSEPTLITDNPYADFDGDGAPDAAVGRLTADTPDELRAMIDKIIAYERSTDFGLWRRQVNCVAGVGGFGMLADAILESSAQYFLTQNIPAAYRVSMTYGSWRSPYCPDPRQFHQTALDRLNEGSWFWVYIGHGQRFGLDWVRMPDNYYPIFNREHVGKLKSQHGSTLALFLACYIGAFDATDCLGEELLRQPGGPVAVLAGSRVTMPYAMSTMSVGLMDEVFQNGCPTLGEAMLRAKQAMLKPAGQNDERRKILDAIAAGLSPSQKLLDDERAEHVLLFNILGDPLLRLKHPQAVRVDVPASVAAGAVLTISGTAPIAGRATIELAVQRGRLRLPPPDRRAYRREDAALSEYQVYYRLANNPRLAMSDTLVARGPFELTLPVPDEASGEIQVNVFIEGKGDCAVGAAALRVEAKRTAE